MTDHLERLLLHGLEKGQETVLPLDPRTEWSHCVSIPSWVIRPKSKDFNPIETDTAPVLSAAMGYIRFLQSEIEVLAGKVEGSSSSYKRLNPMMGVVKAAAFSILQVNA
ncbi:OLC1v1038137C1 [Oldenlandia corymbosa var. corymbosa]|uniref:OLC1v1038137C1 n=1 Tax=Oldenlandia corymbosa var. corymbosa TaxID=529605 RepID=A0AAV1CZ37_OLDCO|nr:OLC1v1038137C1 [Oldenlandia corymbosa var. corymbosa]